MDYAAKPESPAAPLQIESPDGTQIAVWRTGTGRPLVLVHGTTADHTRWRPVLSALASSASVYAMDRRGRGGSQDHQPYAIEREFEDVTAVVDHAAAAAGGPVDLLGHSHGAICSMGAAIAPRRSGASCSTSRHCARVPPSTHPGSPTGWIRSLPPGAPKRPSRSS